MTTHINVEATPQSTRDELAQRSARGYTPVRHSFVQIKRGRRWQGSSLGRLVAARQPRALNAYLLVLMTWGFLEKFAVPLEAAVWARALSPSGPAPAWPPAAMSRVWEALEVHGLIERSRVARLIRVIPLREDGAGAPYTRPRPDQAPAGDTYFIVPDDYWTEGWHETLTLAGRAMLLILLHDTSGRDEAALPYERMSEWYGVSGKTAQNGLDDLRRHGLVVQRQEWIRADLSPIGRTQRTYYSLTGPFSRAARVALQTQTAAAAQARALAPEG